ncbi:MAG: LacI family DNA-binding transcriptional regulator [Chloroflexi bacterium]|nr:LacI family DNA-binding transcriptional regulator [Chloroflexota bacterium]
MAPTNKDVARRAGVSIATVSRVVNQLPNVRPALRRRVLRAVKELNYEPSRTAQRLRVKRSHVLGVIVSDIQNPFFTSVVRGIEDTAYQHGYSLVLCNSDEDTAKEKLYIDVMRAEGVAGLIVAPTRQTNTHLRALLQQHIPVVAIDRVLHGKHLDNVMVDNVEGARQAVIHLLELGHRRIGMVSTRFISTGTERQQGYLNAFQERGLRADRRLIALGAPKPESGYACTRELLNREPRPTAIFVANNMMLVGALSAIREAGLRAPHEISIVGFDDLPWAPLLEPPLTTIAQPTYELGKCAVELALKRIASPDRAAEQVRLKTGLIVRGSTGAPKMGAA